LSKIKKTTVKRLKRSKYGHLNQAATGKYNLSLFSLKRLTFAFLKTQKTREALVKRLQRRLEIAEKEADKAEDPAVKAEWNRLIGFITQTINSLLKAYDAVRFNEDMQELKSLIKECKQLREELNREWEELEAQKQDLELHRKELERREKELAYREAELNRKLEALAKQQTGGGANL
jgi:chromosome segregation ATPase